MSLPERINVMKVISYDVQQICENIHIEEEIPVDEITIDDCLAYIQELVDTDFSSNYIGEYIWQDENGEEL